MNGIHAIIEATGKLAHLSAEELVLLMEDAAKEAGATVLGSNVHKFGTGFGNTGVVLLAESHITVHTWPEDDYAAFDVFMCGDRVNLHRAVDVIKARDPNGRYRVEVIERGIKRLHAVSFEEIAKEIMAETPLLAKNLKRTLGLEKHDATTGLVELLKFLELCSVTSIALKPSLLIDTLWREFVLCTRSYSAFCQRHFGGFLHYQSPDDGTESSRQYQETLDQYLEIFGCPDPKFWGSSGSNEAAENSVQDAELTPSRQSLEPNHNNDTRG